MHYGLCCDDRDLDVRFVVSTAYDRLFNHCEHRLISPFSVTISFEPQASTECDALIARALAIDPNDIDALLTLSSIRMSQSKTDEAKQVILQVSRLVMEIIDRIDKAEEQGEAAVETDDIELNGIGRDRLPAIPTRHLLTRLLLEHHFYVEALRVNDSVRSEDELDVEGCYLEGWAWYCRGEAIEAGEQDGAQDKLPEEDALPSKAECWTEALGSLKECVSVSPERLESG